MKVFRFVGLLGVLLALTYGSLGTAGANSFAVDCYHYCSGQLWITGCNGSLATCCSYVRRFGCPDGGVWEGGTCSDGMSDLDC